MSTTSYTTAVASTPSVRYINPDDLVTKLKQSAGASEMQVIDVRDADFKGGNIVGAVHSPSGAFYENVKHLVEAYKHVKTVVFHCALSQQRGPKSARIYAQLRAETFGDDTLLPPQEVLILRGGFTEFAQKYKNDPALVEKYNSMYHDL